MCGRYHLSQPQRFAEFAGVRLSGTPRPRFNVAPAQNVVAILDDAPDTLGEVRWGLIPVWANDAKIGTTLINARAEKVASTPAFRDAFQWRHCLIAADGFFEWQKLGPKLKQPFNIVMRDDSPFAFAGLWERWKDRAQPEDAEPVKSCTIITTTPNEVVAPIHDRMPVIVPRERYAEWLSPDTTSEARQLMLRPYPAEEMRAYPISSRVRSSKNDDAAILDEVPLHSL